MPAAPKFWQYFLAVEADLSACSRYVEFSEENYSSYSNEFAKIIVIAASEIDSILRELCEQINPEAKANNILQYFDVICGKFQYFNQCEIEVPSSGLRLAPWNGWSKTASPSWWGQGFNKIKHDRSNNFQTANLRNAMCAVGALFLTIQHYHHHANNEPFQVDFNMVNRLFTPAKAVTDKSGMFWSYGVPWQHIIKDSVA